MSSQEFIKEIASQIPNDLQYKYSIDFIGDKLKYNFNDEIKEVIWQEVVNEECNYCGYGDSKYYIFKMLDGIFVFIKFWSGCMTYSSNGLNDEGTIFAYVSNSLYSIYTFCMDDKDRVFFTE